MFQRLIIGFLLFGILFSEQRLYSAGTINTNEYRLQKLEEQLAEVRRDQLNYKIEKDVLKEGFGSTLQTLSIILTLILALFTIVGFLGVRDIATLKKDFMVEFEKLSVLRAQLEEKLKSAMASQDAMEKQYQTLLKNNSEHSSRIQLLELQEKSANMMATKQFHRALEYINIGLKNHSNDLVLLLQKAGCLSRLGDFDSAISAYNDLMIADPNNEDIVINNMELLLFQNRMDEYHKLSARFPKAISQIKDLNVYFSALESYHKGDITNLRSIITSYLSTAKPEKCVRLDKWGFSEYLVFINGRPDSKQKRLLSIFAGCLNGNMTVSEASAAIDTV